MARQGHGFITGLPIRIVMPDLAEKGILVDVAKNGKEIGEIIFIGNLCAKEYYKDEEATKKLFAGGALHSGDLAVWHEDGSAQVLDRQKDIIISGGENISSLALESQLVQHPDILEAGVVAVSDSHWGERPKAFVTVKAGKQLKGEDLILWAKGMRGEYFLCQSVPGKSLTFFERYIEIHGPKRGGDCRDATEDEYWQGWTSLTGLLAMIPSCRWMLTSSF